MKTENKLCRTMLLILMAASLTGCAAGKENPEVSVSSEATLPAYSTVAGNGTESDTTSETSSVPENDDVEPFDFSSDGTPTHKQLEAAAQEYDLWPSESTGVTLTAGGKILREEDVHVFRITDVITGETKYYTAYYKTYKKRGEWDYDITMTSRLYDAEGNVVKDWDEIQYVSCIGDWLMSQNYVDFSYADGSEDLGGKLTDMKTGKETEHILSVDKINADAALVRTEDDKDSFTMDASGKLLYEFSVLKQEISKDYSFSWYGDYVIAEIDDNPLYTLRFYTPEGRLLGKIENVENSYVYSDGIKKPYVLCDNVIYDPSTGDGGDLMAVFQLGETTYYDGELAICNVNGEDDTAGYRLYDAKTGKALSEEYTAMAYKMNSDAQAVSPFFVGTDGNALEKTDRTGKVTATADVENVQNVTIYENGIIADCDGYMRQCLLDTDLKMLTPAGKYAYFYPLYSSDTQNEPSEDDILKEQNTAGYWVGQYFLDAEQLQQRADLFTADGTVLIKGASSIGLLSDGKIPVIRGFSMGLMDLNGKWIVKLAKSEATNND